MSWRPLFDLEHLNVLRAAIPDHPQGAGRGGLVCPVKLIEKSLEEYNYVAVDSKTSGNCCAHAFTQSAIAQGIRPSWKRMADQKRCSDARKLACEWASKHRDDKFWGLTFREIVEIVARPWTNGSHG